MKATLILTAITILSVTAFAKAKPTGSIEECRAEILQAKKDLAKAATAAAATENFPKVEKNCLNSLEKEDKRYYSKVIFKGCEAMSSAKGGEGATTVMQTCQAQGLDYMTRKAE